MKQSDLLFAILRKSKNILKEHSNTDKDRKFIINMKYQYSKLQPVLRNMIKIMAIDIDRFSFINVDINAFASTIESESEIYGNNITRYGHPTLIDKNTGNKFVVYHNNVMSNDIIIFDGNDHYAFIVALGCLVRAHENQIRIIKESEIEEQRMNILSEFR